MQLINLSLISISLLLLSSYIMPGWLQLLIGASLAPVVLLRYWYIKPKPKPSFLSKLANKWARNIAKTKRSPIKRFLMNNYLNKFCSDSQQVLDALKGNDGEVFLPNYSPEAVKEKLAGEVLGQDEALLLMAKVCGKCRGKKLGKWKGPAAVMLLPGPTGVGKTLAAEVLAEAIFGSPDALIRINCNNMTGSDAGRLLEGFEASYAGAQHSAGLTGPARQFQNTGAIVLMDECEKMHVSGWQGLLNILNDGFANFKAKGQRVDLRKFMFIFTCNLWPDRFLGIWDDQEREASEREGRMLDLLATHVNMPEIASRFDAVIPFRGLKEEVIVNIVAKTFFDELKSYDIELEEGFGLDPQLVISTFYESCQVSEYGARKVVKNISMKISEVVPKVIQEYNELGNVITKARLELGSDAKLDIVPTEIRTETGNIKALKETEIARGDEHVPQNIK